MRRVIATFCLGLVLGSSAAAQERRNENGYRVGPPLGCYARTWSDGALASSPQQIIKAMRVRVTDDYPEAFMDRRYMITQVILADQGLAAQKGMGGQSVFDALECSPGYKTEFPFCFAYCDGGRMIFPRMDAQGIVFTVSNFKVGDPQDCSRAINLAGNRTEQVSYRLDRVDDSVCEGL